MNTATAAAQASVTVATIRTWCRYGAVAAVKAAGRWVIDAASLARRITIGATRARLRQEPKTVLNLNATYTFTFDGEQVITRTPKVRIVERPAGRRIRVTNIHALVADRLDAITDEPTRLGVIALLDGAALVIHEHADQRRLNPAYGASRDEGRLVTDYEGHPALPVGAVLDLAEQLREQLAH